jgi:hypothetical protein
MTATVRDVAAALEAAYPPALAESWDAVGLVCGDPARASAPRADRGGPGRRDRCRGAGARCPTTGHSPSAPAARGARGTRRRPERRPGAPAGSRRGRAVLRAHQRRRGRAGSVRRAGPRAGAASHRCARPSGRNLTHRARADLRAPQPEPLRAFTDRVRTALPDTAWGVRAGGDPWRMVTTVAVCGGAGDSLLGAASAAGVDAFVTADLRHHPASEHLAAGGPALVDVAHWASEHPWCEQAATVLGCALGGTVDVHVSYRRTDPWTIGSAQPPGRLPR